MCVSDVYLHLFMGLLVVGTGPVPDVHAGFWEAKPVLPCPTLMRGGGDLVLSQLNMLFVLSPWEVWPFWNGVGGTGRGSARREVRQGNWRRGWRENFQNVK